MIDREALELVEADLESGTELNVHHIGQVFGADAYELIIMLLMDANDAARAIQGAVMRLRSAEDDDAISFDDDDDDEDGDVGF
jgi:hypothetical protein